MKTLPISVLIPTMNRPETLKNTLDSFMLADYVPHQIVIVDQSRDVDTANKIEEITRSYEGGVIDYVYQTIPSLTAARNNALRHATEDIIVCSDDDVYVYSDTVRLVYETMSDTNIAMIAGLDDNSKGKNGKIGYFLGSRSYKKRKIGHVTASVLGRFPDEVKGRIPTEWAMGFFFVVRKSLIQKWNLCWDENLKSYAYAEDLDFSYAYYKSAKKENLECVFDENVHVRHMVSTEYRIPSAKSTFMYVINRAYLNYKHNMGIASRLAMCWCDIWKFVEKVIKNEKPGDMISAMKCLRRNKQAIKTGKIKNLY